MGRGSAVFYTKFFALSCLQGLCKEAAAAECTENPAEELRCVFKAEALAVVESLHQGSFSSVLVGLTFVSRWVQVLTGSFPISAGEASSPGHSSRRRAASQG